MCEKDIIFKIFEIKIIKNLIFLALSHTLSLFLSLSSSSGHNILSILLQVLQNVLQKNKISETFGNKTENS